MPTASSNVRVRGQSGKLMLVLSSSQFDPRRTSVSRHPSNEELSPHSGRGLLRRRTLGDAKSTPSVYNPLLLFGHDRVGHGYEPFESFNRKSGPFSQILGQAYA